MSPFILLTLPKPKGSLGQIQRKMMIILLKAINVFLLFCYYLPFEKGVTLLLDKHESHYQWGLR